MTEPTTAAGEAMSTHQDSDGNPTYPGHRETEPTTAAGRALLDTPYPDPKYRGAVLLTSILAIEAEAYGNGYDAGIADGRAAALDEADGIDIAGLMHEQGFSWDDSNAVQAMLGAVIEALREGGKDVSRGT